jgi:hypothetical protein
MRKATKPESIVESLEASTKKTTAKPSRDEGAVPIHDKGDGTAKGGRKARGKSKAPTRPKSAKSHSSPAKQSAKSGPSAAPPPNADAPASEATTARDKGPKPKRQQTSKARKMRPQEGLDLMWNKGDLFNFLRVLAQASSKSVDRPKEFQRALRLIRRRAAAEPEELVRDVLKSGETIISYLLLRLESQILDQLREFDNTLDNAGGDILPQDFFDRVLPNWIQMQRHLGQIALSRATVSRQIELARAKQLENNRLERELSTLSTSVAPIDGSQSAQDTAPSAPPAVTGQFETDIEDLLTDPRPIREQLGDDFD